MEDTRQGVLDILLEGLPIMEELDTQLEGQRTLEVQGMLEEPGTRLEVQAILDTQLEVQDILEELVIRLEV